MADDTVNGRDFYFKINTGTASVPVFTRLYCEGSFTVAVAKTRASTFGKCNSGSIDSGKTVKIAGTVSGSGMVWAADPGVDALREHGLSLSSILFESSAINGKKWSGSVDLDYSETGEAEGMMSFTFSGPVGEDFAYGS